MLKKLYICDSLPTLDVIESDFTEFSNQVNTVYDGYLHIQLPRFGEDPTPKLIELQSVSVICDKVIIISLRYNKETKKIIEFVLDSFVSRRNNPFLFYFEGKADDAYRLINQYGTTFTRDDEVIDRTIIRNMEVSLC